MQVDQVQVLQTVMERNFGKNKQNLKSKIVNIEKNQFHNFSQEDDDDDMDGGFEVELANMEMDVDKLLGEGPENQQTNIKWVKNRIIN